MGVTGLSAEANEKFKKFLDDLMQAEVISKVSEETKKKLFAKLKEGLQFNFPEDVRVTDRITNDVGVAKAKEIIREFI